MMFALLWVGSLNPKQQERWLLAFLATELVSILISAPLFLFIIAMFTAAKQRRLLAREIQAEKLRAAGKPVPWEIKAAEKKAKREEKARLRAEKEANEQEGLSRDDKLKLQQRRQVAIAQMEELKCKKRPNSSALACGRSSGVKHEDNLLLGSS